MRILVMVILILLIILIGCAQNKTKPYIQKEILYLDLQTIPLKNITQIEIVRDPVLSVIIHHKNGMYNLPFHEYLKIREYLWIK